MDGALNVPTALVFSIVPALLAWLLAFAFCWLSQWWRLGSLVAVAVALVLEMFVSTAPWWNSIGGIALFVSAVFLVHCLLVWSGARLFLQCSARRQC